MLSTILVILHWSIAILLTVRLMVKTRPVGESLAWLFVIYAMPLIGAVVYYSFGERRQGEKRVNNLRKLEDTLAEWQAELSEKCPSRNVLRAEDEAAMARFVAQATGFPVVLVNDWKLLSTYEGIFDELEAMLDAAEHFIHMEFYIWETAGRVANIHEALLRARERGVEVRLLVDSIGGDPFLDSDDRCTLEQAGCEIEVSMKVHLFGGRWDLRNHRKIVVVDGHVAMAGSFNMADPNFFKTKSGVGKWIDAMVRIDGAGAQSLNGVFVQDWCVEKDLNEQHQELWQLQACEVPPTTDRAMPVQVLPSGPGIFPEAIHQVLMMAIYSAQEELIISTPYFVPGDSILQALISAAMRGVRVTLIVPRKSDIRVASFAGASHYQELLDVGISIGLFDGGLLHTKSITIDGRLSVFGTVNLDKRSFWLNSEVTLIVYDQRFTAELRELQMRYWEQGEPLDLDRWNQRGKWRRVVENATRLLSPVL